MVIKQQLFFLEVVQITGENGLAWGFNNVDSAFSGFGGNTQKNNTTVNTIDGKRHTVVLSNEVYTIDGINQVLPNRGTFTKFYNIYLFTWNTSDTADDRCFKGKIYNFKIYDNDVLIRNMIPVLDKNGIACMYDKVNKKFYYNKRNRRLSISRKKIHRIRIS